MTTTPPTTNPEEIPATARPLALNGLDLNNWGFNSSAASTPYRTAWTTTRLAALPDHQGHPRHWHMWLRPNALVNHLVLNHLIPAINTRLAATHQPALTIDDLEQHSGSHNPFRLAKPANDHLHQTLAETIIELSANVVYDACNQLYALTPWTAETLDVANILIDIWAQTPDQKPDSDTTNRTRIRDTIASLNNIDPEMIDSGYANERLRARHATGHDPSPITDVIEDLCAFWLD